MDQQIEQEFAKTFVQKFYRERNGFRLQPQNPLHFPIYTLELEILGKVIGVIKRF